MTGMLSSSTGPGQGSRGGVLPVDFIVEGDDELVLVEIKDPSASRALQRILGNKLTGTEFSDAEPSPGGGSLVALPWESVLATDERTLVMKLTEPRLIALGVILDWYSMAIHPREVIDEHGDMADWRTVVGTGGAPLHDHGPWFRKCR